MKNKRIDDLEKENAKLKKLNHIFLIIIIIGVVMCLLALTIYFHKGIIKKYIDTKRIVDYKNEIKSKYNFDYKYVENNHNAAYKLKLISGDGDNQAYHPKVLNFEKQWHGYKYWMTFSPFPYGNDKYENPNILASNDLINWEKPKGLKNPIENRPDNYKREVVYNSDPHIVYNKDKDIMELYYRYVDDIKDKVIIYRKTSKDGVKWSKKEEILTAKRSKVDYISPAIIYDNGTYKMWFVGKDRTLRYMESKDGYKYENERTISLRYPIGILKTWHIDVIKTKKGYELITVAYKSWPDRNSMSLYYFSSKNNKDYTKGRVILRPSVLSWDNRGIYRSSLMYEKETYYVFYSGIGTDFERGIGMSYGKNIENLIGSNIKKK